MVVSIHTSGDIISRPEPRIELFCGDLTPPHRSDTIYNELGVGIALDSRGDAYVVGQTNSMDFPTTPGAYQETYGGGWTDAFIAKFEFGSGPSCPVMAFDPGVLPQTSWMNTYSDHLMTVTGATGPMTFSFLGVMPPWMLLSSTGFISGDLVTNLGTYNFKLIAQDAAGCEASQEYTVTSKVGDSPALCLKDDVDSRKMMTIDFVTGNYTVSADAMKLTGTGTITVTSNHLELVDRSAGNRISATINRLNGNGQVWVTFGLPHFPNISIRDLNVTDNKCPIRP